MLDWLSWPADSCSGSAVLLRACFSTKTRPFHGHSDDVRNASAGGFCDPARVLAKPVRILPISLENPLMRTCADDACGEAIHDQVNDKLPPWPRT
jgi:hypothetical protein